MGLFTSRLGSVVEVRILEVMVIGGEVPEEASPEEWVPGWPTEWMGELAEWVASEEEEEEWEMEEADGLMAELGCPSPVGEAFRRKRDLNFIICPPFFLSRCLGSVFHGKEKMGY